MVAGSGAGEQVNLNDLDSQMEQIKEMFVKKQEMMKKMSTGVVSNKQIDIKEQGQFCLLVEQLICVMFENILLYFF